MACTRKQFRLLIVLLEYFNKDFCTFLTSNSGSIPRSCLNAIDAIFDTVNISVEL